MAVQLAHELGSRVIGTGRAADREAALGLGADIFVDLQADRLEEIGEVDVVFEVIGGEVLERSAPLAGRTLVTIIGLPQARPVTAGDLLFAPEPDGSGWRTSPSGCGPAAAADHRGRTAAGRGTVRVHARPPDPRQDDHPRHGRRITEGGRRAPRSGPADRGLLAKQRPGCWSCCCAQRLPRWCCAGCAVVGRGLVGRGPGRHGRRVDGCTAGAAATLLRPRGPARRACWPRRALPIVWVMTLTFLVDGSRS